MEPDVAPERRHVVSVVGEMCGEGMRKEQELVLCHSWMTVSSREAYDHIAEYCLTLH